MILMLVGFALHGMAQSTADRAQVLQTCLDLEQLQQHYPRDNRGNIKQINIMQHGVSFPENISVVKNGLRPIFLSKQQINSTGTLAYFLFHDFTISSTSATVAFVYHYSVADQFVVYLDLEKNGSTWSIKKSNITIDHETE